MADELTAETGSTRASSLTVEEQRDHVYSLLGSFVNQHLGFGTLSHSMSDRAVRDVLRPWAQLLAGVHSDPKLRHHLVYQDVACEFLEEFERMTREDFFELAEADCAARLAAYEEAKREELSDRETVAVAEAEAWTRLQRSSLEQERARLSLSKFSRPQPEPDGPVVKPRSRETRARGPPVAEGEDDDDDPHEVAPNAVRFHFQLAVRDRDCPLSSTQRLVALIYSTHMDSDGTNAWPGADLLAAETGLHKGTVKRVRGELERLGWLIADRRPGRTTNYAAAFPRGVIQDDPLVIDDDPGVTQDDGRGHPGRPDLVLEVAPNSFQPHSPAPDGAVVEWQSIRRDRCRLCERFLQVDGEGLCIECWGDERD